MSTPTMRDDDGRPPAVRHAQLGEEAWRAVAAAQLTASPNHSDFYDLAGCLSPTLYTLMDLANVLAHQVAGYGQDRPVYDDTRTVDPQARLARAAAELRAMRDALATARGHAERFWSEIAHVGVEVTP